MFSLPSSRAAEHTPVCGLWLRLTQLVESVLPSILGSGRRAKLYYSFVRAAGLLPVPFNPCMGRQTGVGSRVRLRSLRAVLLLW